MKWQRGDQYTKRELPQKVVGYFNQLPEQQEGQWRGFRKSKKRGNIEDGARALVAGLEWHQGLWEI